MAHLPYETATPRSHPYVPARLETTIGRTPQHATARANTITTKDHGILATFVARLPCPAILADDQGVVCAVSAGAMLRPEAPPDIAAGRPLRDCVAALFGPNCSFGDAELRRLCEETTSYECDVEVTGHLLPAPRSVRVSAFSVEDDAGAHYRVVLAVESPPAASVKPAPPAELVESLNHGLQPSLANIKSAALGLHTTSRRWEPAAQQEMLRVIQHEADTVYEALGAYNELVSFTAGRAHLRRRPVELSDTLMSLLAQWKPLAPTHAFELAMPGEVPLLSADEDRIALAINLLLEHAVRLTPSGDTIRVDIRPGPDGVTVGIHHRGYAAAPDELPHFFEPFYHLRAAPDARVRGGMGLALAEAIATAHGGRLWAEVRDGFPGMAVGLSLPYAPPPRDASVTTAAPAADATVSPPLARRTARRCALVVESDARMLRYLRANLDGEQYRAAVATSMADAQAAIDRDDPDVILLDAQIPGEGLSAMLQTLREETGAPIVVLARRHDPIQCAEALDLGASDYLAKPFSIEELLARVRVALRHRDAALKAVSREPIFEHGGLVIDFEQRAVSVEGKPVALSKTEFKLLKTLAQHRNMVLSHELLLEHVWGPAYSHEVEFVWVYIRRLRRKIEPHPSAPRYILTVPGVGYRLAGC